MEVVLRPDSQDDWLTWGELAFVWALFSSLVAAPCMCCWLGNYLARWTTRRQNREAPKKVNQDRACQTESPCGIEPPIRRNSPPLSISLEEGERPREDQGGRFTTPRKRTITPKARAMGSRENILHDMARRAQPVIREVERRQLSWLVDPEVEDESTC